MEHSYQSCSKRGAHPDQFFIFDQTADSISIGVKLFVDQQPTVQPREILSYAFFEINHLLQPYGLHVDKRNPTLIVGI